MSGDSPRARMSRLYAAAYVTSPTISSSDFPLVSFSQSRSSRRRSLFVRQAAENFENVDYTKLRSS